MIPLKRMAGKPVAVMGLGRSGLHTAQALISSGATVRAWDDNADRRNAAESEGVPVAPLTNGAWTDVESLVLSPGIPHTYPAPHAIATAARTHGVEIIGDIELLKRAVPEARFIGITGTNGKSTTTALIGHILETAGRTVEIGGNLGRPALDLEQVGADGFYVLELSSFQIELTPSAGFDIAVLLNISPDHLERHGGMDGYVAAKRHIFDDCHGTAVIGVDDPTCVGIYGELRDNAAAKTIPISSTQPVDGGVYAISGTLIDNIDGKRTKVADIGDIGTLPGDHNAQNAAAAYAVARAAGLAPNDIAAGLRSYPGLAHRQQLIAVIDGVRYINDSKATNPEAAARALSCYRDIYWIAGGRAKEGGLEALHPYLTNIKHGYLIGEAAELFAQSVGRTVDVRISGTLEKAIIAAQSDAKREKCDGAVVLLSPACASYDQYSDFEARGRDFERCVRGLTGRDREFFGASEAIT